MNTKQNRNIPLITIILAAVNIAVFLLTDLVFFRRQGTITYYAALNPVLVLKGKEYWRLFTAMFYHFDIEHVMYNMLMLYYIGAILEPIFGRLRFLILYFVSGLLADAASIIYNSLITGGEGVFCAGASGAVFGLLGAFVIAVLWCRNRISFVKRRDLPVLVFFVLFAGLFETGVDHAAHFGGFLAGVLLGAVFLWRKRDVSPADQKA